MQYGSLRPAFRPSWCTRIWLGAIIFGLGFSVHLRAQTASTGALTGVALDPSGAVLPDVIIHLTREDGTERKSATSDENGRFGFMLLPPGTYQLLAGKSQFKLQELQDLRVSITETLRVELHLELATRTEGTGVSSEPLMVQLDASAVGRVVDERTASGLPLVTRNFAQITGLSTGVSVGVYNAGELGTGATAQAQIGKTNDGIYAHGARSYDNNWQLDGISVSDAMSSGTASGGIPIPNPDTIEEFKVQTAAYDAAFGRGVGANVSIITRAGGNDFHGTVFEFLGNNVLNADDFFLNETAQARPDLKQNQFGVTLGGPIQKQKLLFFSSYQGTRQINGLASGQARIACSASLSEPPLTNDRSPAALGQLFSGMKGALGGAVVDSNGSNINPVALALLNFKLPDSSYLIPTPQTIDPLKPFASQGFSVFSEPCRFNENQFLLNIDYDISSKNRLTGRSLISRSDQTVTFPGNGMNTVGNIPGFTSPGKSEFVVFSLADTYVLSNTSLNEVRLGYVRTQAGTAAEAPFSWSSVGVSEGDMNDNNALPSLSILGSISMASAFPRTYTQNSFVFNDVLSRLEGAHALRFGGSLTRLQDNLNFAGFGSYLQFLSWPDFLLGLDSSGNGTGTFSNIFASEDAFGLLNRQFRAWEGSAFAQDDYHIDRSLTLNLGLRYERLGQFGDNLGRNSSFDFSRADENPPPAGSADGYVVSANFPGAVPPGVLRADNTAGTYGQGQNAIAPRIGFAWQILPWSNRLALRGGYGIYYSRPTGQAFTSSVLSAPFALTRVSTGPGNASATFQEPFAQPFPSPTSFPMFVPYSAATHLSANTLASDFRPAMVQQFSVNTQAELKAGWLLEIGYIGVRGVHLQRFLSLNQALSASPADPINGVASNTLANVPLRVPVPGIRPDALREMEAEGESWYSGLEVSLTKRLSHGLQFLASYTFSKSLDTDGSEINGISAANTLPLGNQNSPSQRWGRSSIDRPQRFVLSATWALPSPSHGIQHAVFGGWDLGAVTTIQSGTALTIAYTNANNVFGISEDRAQLSGSCTNQVIVTGGPIGSKLSNYFNESCFTTPPVIGADGIATAFGNSGTGIVDGPGQANLDLALTKAVEVAWPREKSSVEFRAEFFNALNHPQFASPDTNFSSPTFGVISSTAVNARVGRLAVRLSF
jgi:hypothetical protein